MSRPRRFTTSEAERAAPGITSLKSVIRSRNNIYLIYKNMPVLQILLNLPAFILGFSAKLVFFASKGYGKEYLAGIKNGFSICRKPENKAKKIRFCVETPRYVFCHRMGAFYQCVPEISGAGVRQNALEKENQRLRKWLKSLQK